MDRSRATDRDEVERFLATLSYVGLPRLLSCPRPVQSSFGLRVLCYHLKSWPNPPSPSFCGLPAPFCLSRPGCPHPPTHAAAWACGPPVWRVPTVQRLPTDGPRCAGNLLPLPRRLCHVGPAGHPAHWARRPKVHCGRRQRRARASAAAHGRRKCRRAGGEGRAPGRRGHGARRGHPRDADVRWGWGGGARGCAAAASTCGASARGVGGRVRWRPGARVLVTGGV